LRGFLIATDDLKLHVAAAEGEAGTTAGAIIVIAAHGASTTFTPVVVSIPASVPSVAAFVPSSLPVIIVSRRALARR